MDPRCRWIPNSLGRLTDCDLPQGQAQLQSLSTTIQILTLAHLHLPDLAKECMSKVEKLLQVFFLDPTTRYVLSVNTDPIRKRNALDDVLIDN